MGQQSEATKDDLGLQQVLEAGYKDAVLSRVQDDPVMFAVVTDIEEGLATLQKIIDGGKLSATAVEKLQTVTQDGVSLLTACVAFGSTQKTPPSILNAVDGWVRWVDGLATDVAIAIAGNE